MAPNPTNPALQPRQENFSLRLFCAPQSRAQALPSLFVNSLSASLSEQLYSLRSPKQRLDVPHGTNSLHISRVPCEDNAKLVLELLSSDSKPKVLDVFCPTVAIIKSARQDLFTPFERIYVISDSFVGQAPLDKSVNPAFRMRIIGKLISNLSSLHSIGLICGDTSIENIAVKNNTQPVFRSAGHMRAFDSPQECINELFYMLASLLSNRALHKSEIIHLIHHYLLSDNASYSQLKSYLNNSNPNLSQDEIELALTTRFNSYYSTYF